MVEGPDLCGPSDDEPSLIPALKLAWHISAVFPPCHVCLSDVAGSCTGQPVLIDADALLVCVLEAATSPDRLPPPLYLVYAAEHLLYTLGTRLFLAAAGGGHLRLVFFRAAAALWDHSPVLSLARELLRSHLRSLGPGHLPNLCISLEDDSYAHCLDPAWLTRLARMRPAYVFLADGQAGADAPPAAVHEAGWSQEAMLEWLTGSSAGDAGSHDRRAAAYWQIATGSSLLSGVPTAYLTPLQYSDKKVHGFLLRPCARPRPALLDALRRGALRPLLALMPPASPPSGASTVPRPPLELSRHGLLTAACASVLSCPPSGLRAFKPEIARESVRLICVMASLLPHLALQLRALAPSPGYWEQRAPLSYVMDAVASELAALLAAAADASPHSATDKAPAPLPVDALDVLDVRLVFVLAELFESVAGAGPQAALLPPSAVVAAESLWAAVDELRTRDGSSQAASATAPLFPIRVDAVLSGLQNPPSNGILAENAALAPEEAADGGGLVGAAGEEDAEFGLGTMEAVSIADLLQLVHGGGATASWRYPLAMDGDSAGGDEDPEPENFPASFPRQPQAVSAAAAAEPAAVARLSAPPAEPSSDMGAAGESGASMLPGARLGWAGVAPEELQRRLAEHALLGEVVAPGDLAAIAAAPIEDGDVAATPVLPRWSLLKAPLSSALWAATEDTQLESRGKSAGERELAARLKRWAGGGERGRGGELWALRDF